MSGHCYDDFTEEQANVAKARKLFLEQLLYIVLADDSSATADEQLTAFRQLARIGRPLLGELASQLIRERIAELLSEVQKVVAVPSQIEEETAHFQFAKASEVCLRDYSREMRPLLQLFKEKGYVRLPPQSENSSTSLSGTKQYPSKFPENNRINLKWLAECLGCSSVTHVDNKGWNIVHHVMHIIPSSDLALDIALKIGDRAADMPSGDIRMAMKQRTTGFQPYQATPVHMLCTNSDSHYKKLDLIKILLKRGVLEITDFDQKNDKVFAFSFKELSHCR